MQTEQERHRSQAMQLLKSKGIPWYYIYFDAENNVHLQNIEKLDPSNSYFLILIGYPAKDFTEAQAQEIADKYFNLVTQRIARKWLEANPPQQLPV